MKFLCSLLPTADIARFAGNTKAMQSGHEPFDPPGEAKAEYPDSSLSQGKRSGSTGFPSVVFLRNTGAIIFLTSGPRENHNPDSLPCPTNSFA